MLGECSEVALVPHEVATKVVERAHLFRARIEIAKDELCTTLLVSNVWPLFSDVGDQIVDTFLEIHESLGNENRIGEPN